MKGFSKEEEQIREELYSWIEKNNALMFASGNGNKKVQTLKCMLSYKFFKNWYEQFSKSNPMQMKLMEEVADEFMKLVGTGITLTGDEAEKKLKEEGY